MADDWSDGAHLTGAAYFGTEVRAWRTDRGLSQRELGEKATYGQQYVAKVEAGERLASPEFAEACDRVFGTPGMFARLRERVARRGYPDWFEPYVRLEQRATVILSYNPTLVMGMLQTEAYAHAVFRKAHPRDDLDVTAEKVARRLKRRQVMEVENPPLLWVVLDESCLRHTIGSPEVMHEQLAHLLRMADTPHVTLQIFPFKSGAPATHLPFVVLKFADGESDVLYVEDPVSGQVIDSPQTVADANVTYDRLRADALSPEESLALIRDVMKEWTR
ncbi:helix-turn-helix transcriptional regulator [Streptomyces olivoreticuli]|uniref:Helix-turn-helix transcriptional regulator n=1 Tax=Streptomyces blastmyceticus TaxID=68180 RepID=A0ABP3HDY0_9ACTN|nr:helix-turn-helix transcriptional regulator [Streptomyces olivoreticuli]WKK25057.1 helix-turn-helix transcriptional regulator [Streptomyces olivoreticuli]